MDTYCNPLNLSYRFAVEGWADQSLREAADPSVIVHRGRYLLFASKTGGFWHSSDLRQWQFVQTPMLPSEDYAPDVRVIDGQVTFTASRNTGPCPIYRSPDPLAGQWELVSEPLMFWDPNIFQDEDGRVYLYHGCSCDHPIWGMELDRQSLEPITEPVELVHQRDAELGWERFNENNAGGHAPWVEGAWMTFRDGVYYFQYAAPGTQWNTYADAVYVGQGPLGPFELQPHNPYSHKAGGFITGAGHGSTFEDHDGNFWHAATMRISVRHDFERRLGLFPAGFDADGVLFCNTRFGDYPHRLPEGRWDAWNDAFTGWMLLSYRKPCHASAALDGHQAEHAFDEDIRTYWAAPAEADQPTLSVDLGSVCAVRAVQVNFAEHLCSQFGREGGPLYHQYVLDASADGESWSSLIDKRDNRTDVPHDYVQLAEPARVRHLRLTILHMPGGGTAAVSGLRVFGLGAGAAPARAEGLTVTRDAGDRCVARIAWQPSAGAIGYNVRWGVAPDKLYCSWLVYDAAELELRALAADRAYWFAVEAFNENGVAAPAGAVGDE